MQRSSLVKYAEYPTFVNNPYIWDLQERKKEKKERKKKKKTFPENYLTSLNAIFCPTMTNGPTFVTTTQCVLGKN